MFAFLRQFFTIILSWEFLRAKKVCSWPALYFFFNEFLWYQGEKIPASLCSSIQILSFIPFWIVMIFCCCCFSAQWNSFLYVYIFVFWDHWLFLLLLRETSVSNFSTVYLSVQSKPHTCISGCIFQTYAR